MTICYYVILKEFNMVTSFLRPELIKEIEKYDDLTIKKSSSKKFTNFIFETYEVKSNELSSKPNEPHELNVYKYWSYDEATNLPKDNPFFLKMIHYINSNNPTTSKHNKKQKKTSKSPVNYLLLSE